MRVAIRADASASLGTGHLRRSLSLARALTACGVEAMFLSRKVDEVASAVLREEPFTVHWLEGAATDAGECAAVLQDDPVQWVVVDHYKLDSVWHDAVRKQLGCRIAVIDDLADRPLAPDLLIDHNDPEAADKYASRLQRECGILAGPHFALLDLAYASAARYGFNAHVRSIGIFMGGTDPNGHCLAALRACRRVLGFTGPVEVVCSPASPGYAQLADECARWPDTRLVDALPDLAAFFARHDLQIGAGGGSVWERCCIGVPTIACVIAPNQLSTVPRLAALGALAWARDEDGGPEAALAAQARKLLDDPELRRSLGETAGRLVDGLGSARVAAVLSSAGGAGLTLREAAAGDELLLLEWANDPVVRASAFRQAPVQPQDHARWFAARLADRQDCSIFILEAPNGIPVGQVRFERRGGISEIGYSVAAPFRGLGVAAQLLQLAVDALPREGATEVLGRVKPDNEASARVFRRLGFAESRTQDERGDHLVFKLRLRHGDNRV